MGASISSGHRSVATAQEAQEQYLEGARGTCLEGVRLPPEQPYRTVNELVALNVLKVGDPIEFEDNALRHWALYAGQLEPENIPMVAHYFSIDGNPHEIRYDTLETAACGKRCRVNKKYDAKYNAKPPEEIMKTAQ